MYVPDNGCTHKISPVVMNLPKFERMGEGNNILSRADRNFTE